MSINEDSVANLDCDSSSEVGTDTTSEDEVMENDIIADRFVNSLDQEVVPDEVIEDFLLYCIGESKMPPVSIKNQASLREEGRHHRAGTENNYIGDGKPPSYSTKYQDPLIEQCRIGNKEAIKPGVVWVNGIGSSPITEERTEESDPEAAIDPPSFQAYESLGSVHSSLALSPEYLVQAQTVQDNNNNGVQGSIIATAKPDPWWRRNQWWLTLAFVVTIFGATIAIIVSVTKVNETDMPTASPTTLENGTEERISNLIVSHFPQSEEALMDESTSQYKALRWVTERELLNLESSTDDHILQQYSLVTFYLSTNSNGNKDMASSSWKKDNGWLGSQNECTWYGVECGKVGTNFESKVIGLNLSSNALSGTIPADIAILSSSLSSLVLENNNIMGSIPPEIGRLSLLSSLNFSRNKLNGVLAEFVGEMLNLLHLNLSENILSSTIPTQLGMLSALRSIKLGNNKLMGAIPSQIGELANLEELDFRSNELSYALPKEIGSVSALEKLYLQNNKLLGPLPSELGLMSKLQVVDMSRNYVFEKIPAELWQMGGLPNLEHLDLSHNLLTGTLPDDFGKSWERLRILRLGGKNFLQGALPSTIVTFGLLEELDLSSNFLGGTIPRVISNLKNLQSLNLSGNELRGSLPETLYLLTDLDVLDFSGNQLLTGTLTSSIEKLPKLRSFGVSGVSGTIPSEIWSLTRLQNLELSSTAISDMLSSDLGALSKLTSLNLSNNKSLQGTIPTELGTLTALSSLNLAYSSITGTIPTEVGLLVNLEVFQVRNNKISGSLPSEMGHMIALKDINTGINRMTGSIPSELGFLTELFSLRPGANLLRGTIPSEIGRLTNLEDLRLVLTALTGTIPSEFRNLIKLQKLYLYDTRLSGKIPNEICAMAPQTIVNVDCKEVDCHCCGCAEYNPSTAPSLSPMPTQTILPTKVQSSLPTLTPSTTPSPSTNLSSLPISTPSMIPYSNELCSVFTPISSFGSPLSDFDEDDHQVVDLPFMFNFRLGEEQYTNITVHRKGGRVIIGTENIDLCAPGIVGGALYKNGAISNLFSGGVYTTYSVESSTFVISWEGEFSAGYSVNFQIVLFSAGDIEIRWGIGMYPPQYLMVAAVVNTCLNRYISVDGDLFSNVFGPVMVPENGIWPSNRCVLYSTDANEGYITKGIRDYN